MFLARPFLLGINIQIYTYQMLNSHHHGQQASTIPWFGERASSGRKSQVHF